MSVRIPSAVPFGLPTKSATSQHVAGKRLDKADGALGATASPCRSSGRISARRLTELATILGAKDYAILETLRVVHVASARQLERIHFHAGTALSNARLCRKTLRRLSELRLVCRLERSAGGQGRGGSAAWLYGLDVAGQRLLNHAAGRRPRRPVTPTPAILHHALGVTETYALAREAEREGAIELLAFQAEPVCWRTFIDLAGRRTLKPDAYVSLGIGERERRWFIELDRGTVSAAALRAKVAAYLAYYQAREEQTRSGIFPRVLWLVTNQDRKRALISLIGREKPESQRLHSVALMDEAAGFLAGRRSR